MSSLVDKYEKKQQQQQQQQEEGSVPAEPILGRKRYVGLGLRPDSKFNSQAISKMINIIMWDGNKSAATRVIYDALDIVKTKVSDRSPVEVFEEAVDNVKPLLEVRSKRVGGATYQIPMEVKPRRQNVLAFRWIKDAFRKKKGRSSAEKLAAEILDAFNKQGTAMATRENTHKMAEANKAFAYYA